VPNVPDEESPLASGMAPAREAESAGDMPEVPKGRGFAPSARSASCYSVHVLRILSGWPRTSIARFIGRCHRPNYGA